MMAKPDGLAEADTTSQRRSGLRLRSLMMVVVLVAVGLTLARETFLFWFLLGFVGLLASGVAMIGLGVAANLVGFLLFGAIDWVVAACRGAGRWPDEKAKGKAKQDDGWDDFRPI